MSKKGHRKSSGKRRSKAENMTGAKANEAEMRTASDLNLGEPVVIESSDFHLHLRACKAATEKKDTANNLLRGCYKAANKVHPELGRAIKEAITIERDADPAKLKARLEVLGIALKETGCPIQLSVFDALAGDPMAQAYARGQSDSKGNRMAACPYPEGSDLSAEYLRGFTDHQANIIHGANGNGGDNPNGAEGDPWPDDQPGQGGDGRELEPDDNARESANA